jgi:hypothetical protein
MTDGHDLYQVRHASPEVLVDALGREAHPCPPGASPPGPNPNCTPNSAPCGPPPPPPARDAPTCDGQGNCQANLSPGTEAFPGPVRDCILRHECVHCSEIPANSCCGRFANGDPPDPPDRDEQDRRECSAYSTSFVCMTAAQGTCGMDQARVRLAAQQACNASCRRGYHCSSSPTFRNPGALNQCLSRCP